MTKLNFHCCRKMYNYSIILNVRFLPPRSPPWGHKWLRPHSPRDPRSGSNTRAVEMRPQSGTEWRPWPALLCRYAVDAAGIGRLWTVRQWKRLWATPRGSWTPNSGTQEPGTNLPGWRPGNKKTIIIFRENWKSTTLVRKGVEGKHIPTKAIEGKEKSIREIKMEMREEVIAK